MHDLIYENQRHLSVPLLFKLSEQLELSPKELENALKQRAYEPRVQQDFMGGARSGVNGTPTFFINGQRHDGAFGYEDLIAAIESVLVK